MNSKYRKLLRYSLITFAVALLGFFVISYNILHFRIEDNNYLAKLNDNPFGLKADVSYYTHNGRRVRYVEIGRDSLPLIVFVHGAPSSSSFWEDMLRDSTLLSRAKLLAVDRPGYGFSGYGKPELSLKKQAKIISPILKKKRKEHPAIVLHGSSYGGTLVARLAMDYPNLIDGILLQSASVAPGEEKTYWITYPTSHWSLKWLVPPALQIANAEKLSHKIQLDSMASLWHRIKSKAIILHGDNDALIYPKNAYFAKEKMVNASIVDFRMLPGRGHDLLWTKRELLIESLLKLLSIEQKNKTH